MDIELFGKLIFSGEIEKVREIIQSGIDLNLPNSKEMTPILLAIVRRSATNFRIAFEKRSESKSAV